MNLDIPSYDKVISDSLSTHYPKGTLTSHPWQHEPTKITHGDLTIQNQGFKTPSSQLSNCTYFTTKSYNLQHHFKAVHQKIKEIQCNQCPYETSYKQQLTRHIKSVHTKLKDFVCDKCSFATSEKKNLEQHIKSV